MTQPPGPSPARHLATMRHPVHPAGLATIIERRPRRPIPTPVPQGPLPRYGFVIAVVVAHEAEHRLATTLESLDTQTRRPDAVVVVADRCTDATVVTALVHGATVVETSDNPHGWAGGLNLALREVLALVDDDDAVLIVSDHAVVAPRFVAAGLAELWAPTPTEPSRRLRGSRRPPGLVVSTPAVAGRPASRARRPGGVLRPLIGAGWPARHSLGSADATMALAGALRDVAASRVTTTHDPAPPDVFDVTSPSPTAELTVMLDALGYRVMQPDRCLTTTSSATAPGSDEFFAAARDTQHALLAAAGRPSATRRVRCWARTQGAPLLTVAFPIVASATLAAVLATGGPALPLAVAVGLAALACTGERAWAARHVGRHLGAELARGLARATAGAAGVVVGTWGWLADLRLRRKVWRHPVSARVLARRRGPFDSLRDVSLVRVGGSAIAIERSGSAPDVLVERWRRRALAASAGGLALVVTIVLPLTLPVPSAVAVALWATGTTVVSVVRIGRSVRGRRSSG